MDSSNEWIDDFIQIRFTTNTEDSNILQAQALKEPHIPKKLFKYRSLAGSSKEYSLQLVQNESIWLAKPSSFNDPFDSALGMDTSESNQYYFQKHIQNIPKFDEYKAKLPDVIESLQKGENIHDALKPTLLKEMSEEHANGLIEVFESFLAQQGAKRTSEFCAYQQDSLRVCCASAVHDNMLLWSHYADNHAGFCIEYDIERIPPFHPQRMNLFPVKYSNHFPDVTKFLMTDTDKLNIFFPTYCAMHKATCWSYEQEWRFILQTGGTGNGMSTPVPISGLYIGARTSDENKKIIKDIGVKKNLPVYAMRTEENSFVLTSEQIA